MSYVPSPSEKCYGSITGLQALSSDCTPLPPGRHHNEVLVNESPKADDQFRGLAVPRRRVRRR